MTVLANPSSPSTAGSTTRGSQTYGRLAAILGLALVLVVLGCYLYLCAKTAEFERDRAVLEKDLVAAKSAVSVSDANCRSAITACAEKEKACQKDLDNTKRSLGQMVQTPTISSATPTP